MTKQKRSKPPPAQLGCDNSATATVVASFGKTLLIETQNGALLQAKLAKRRLGAVCGDIVCYQQSPDGEASVTELQPRRSVVERGDFRGRPKPLAANVNQLLIAVAPEPLPQPLLIDRCLIGAELSGIHATLLRTKADIQSDECDALLVGYQQLGYPLLHVCRDQADSLNRVRNALAEQQTLIIGASGVGKSSLVNALVPNAELRVGAISAASGEGKHTTTSSRLFRLSDSDPTAGSLIDSPGIRDFHPPRLEAPTLADCFLEFRQHLGHCKFANCQHTHEPKCAILAAKQAGAISARRYSSYVALLNKTEN